MSLSVVEEQLFNFFKLVYVSDVEQTEDVLKRILETVKDNNDTKKEFHEYLKSINSVIGEYEMEIVQGIDETTMKKSYCLISVKDDLTEEGEESSYTKETNELLLKIIEKCVLSEDGFIQEIDCYNLHLSFNDEAVVKSELEKLVGDKWLVSKDGIISLGLRCMLNMEMYIKRTYPENVSLCIMCKKFLMQGNKCEECEKRIHVHCARIYYEIDKLFRSNQCPFCGAANDGIDFAKLKSCNVSTSVEAPSTISDNAANE